MRYVTHVESKLVLTIKIYPVVDKGLGENA